MGKRSLDDARTFGRSIQPTHDLQPEAGSADGSSLFAILDANEIEADAQPKKITLSGVANVVGPLLTPTAIPAAGANTQVQFNDGGFFGADGGLTYNKTTDALNAGAFIPTGSTVPTNGVYLPSANNVALSTNGTGRLFVDANGCVGIGAAPDNQAYRLQIYNPSQDFAAISLGNTVSGSGALNGLIIAQNQNDAQMTNRENGYLYFGTNNTERLRITSAGLVGIGTTSPSEKLTVADGSIQIESSTASGADLRLKFKPGFSGTYGNQYIAAINAELRIGASTVGGSSAFTTFYGQAGTEQARIDSSGRLLVGTSSARTNVFADLTTALTPAHQIETVVNSSWSTGLSIINNSSAGFAPVLTLGLSCANSVGSNTLVPNGNTLGRINFAGNDGTNFVCGARIAGETDGTTGSGDLPSRLVFSTTSDGAASPTERFRITNDGVRGYNQPAPAAVDATATLTVANLKTGIITSSTAAAVTMTLPTGTLTEGGFSGLYNNFTFEWTVINTGATNAVTVQGDTGHTLVGSGTVAAGVSGRFASRRTAANTFVTYRLS